MKQTSKKFPLTLSMLSNTCNNKITASQQSVLTPHRGQESILSCISSSPSHQHLNGCAVNPLGSRKKKKGNKFLLCSLLLHSLLQEDQRIPTHPFTQRAQQVLHNPNTTVDILSPRAALPHVLSAVSSLLPLQVLILLRKKKKHRGANMSILVAQGRLC